MIHEASQRCKSKDMPRHANGMLEANDDEVR